MPPSAGVRSALSISVAMAPFVSLGAGIRMLMEEALLRERYPEYAGYASRTRRVIPFVL